MKYNKRKMKKRAIKMYSLVNFKLKFTGDLKIKKFRDGYFEIYFKNSFLVLRIDNQYNFHSFNYIL